MSLKEKISEDMKAAMRAKESEKLATIRLLTAAIKQREVDERIDLLAHEGVGLLEDGTVAGGQALEEYATRRASSVLAALARRNPTTAHRATDAGVVDVPLSEVQVGDRLVVLPHETCPVDGVVVARIGAFNHPLLNRQSGN